MRILLDDWAAYYGDGSYWGGVEGIIKRCEKQQVSNVSSMIHFLSHFRDSHPTRLVLADSLSPNIILDGLRFGIRIPPSIST